MPVFDFHNFDNGKTISVLVRHTEPDHARHTQIGEDGLIYKRVYSAPFAAKDSIVKDASAEDFRRMTNDKKGLNTGQMWKLSREMSEYRADKNGGHDPVREKFYKDYEKRVGDKHADVKKRERDAQQKKAWEDFGLKIVD